MPLRGRLSRQCCLFVTTQHKEVATRISRQCCLFVTTQHKEIEIIFKMLTKCLIVVMLVAGWQNTASSHVFTSMYSEQPQPYCMKHLMSHITLLCPIQSGELIPESSVESTLLDFKRWDSLTKCCTRPCTYHELLELC